MPILVDVKGYEMVGDDTISGDSFEEHPSSDVMLPYNHHPVGVNAGGYDLCCVAWVDTGGKIRSGIIRVIPK